MPAYSTHYLFAKELEEDIKNTVDFDLDECAYFVGTQGPDIFFDHRVMPWMAGKTLRKVGSLLHRSKPAEILNEMRSYINLSNEKDIAKSYAAGFILHYALDCKCHPFVYALQNKITRQFSKINPHSAHNTIEFSMDVYLLNKRLNIELPYAFDTASTMKLADKSLDELGKMISFVTTKVTGKAVSPGDCVTAVKDLKYVQKLTTDKNGKKEKFVSVIDRAIAAFSNNFELKTLLRPKDLENAKKYGNIEREIWQSPYDNEKRNDSFEDLFDFAKEDALKIVKSFFACEDTYKITQNKSFLTGVEVR